MKKVYIKTFGCQMNELDSQLVKDMLTERGYTITDDPREADVVLINTCTVREKAARKAVHLLRHFKNRGKFVGIMGCLAQQEGERLRHLGADLVVGTRSYNLIPELLESSGNVVCHDFGLHYRTKRLSVKKSEYVSIQYGCDNFCTFCVVPYTRGREVCRPAEEILEEIRFLDRAGCLEVTLLGQNVNSYFDGKYDFADLLKMVQDTVRGIRRIRFTSPNPRDFSYKVLKVIADGDLITPWVHLPLQSGSDEILRRMNRGYNRSEYLEQALMIRDMMPEGTISTDIIVGFPGETEEDFQKTLQVVREVKYDWAYMFVYSQRPNTPASLFKDQIPYEVKVERQRRLIDEVMKYAKERRKLFLGKEYEVLVEKKAKDGNSIGKIPNGLTVKLRGDYREYTFVKTKIVGLDGLTFIGEEVATCLTG